MHDYFDILGVPGDAPAQAIRRACARRAPRAHPDFDGMTPLVHRDRGSVESLTGLSDIAIDFVDMSAIVDRMQATFFAAGSSTIV